jgi:hypothetical protein
MWAVQEHHLQAERPADELERLEGRVADAALEVGEHARSE